MLRRIARTSVDRLAVFLRNPDGPAGPDAAIADVSEPEPQKPQRRPRSAAAPSAAERLALAASR
jgi:hypothetical protein